MSIGSLPLFLNYQFEVGFSVHRAAFLMKRDLNRKVVYFTYRNRQFSNIRLCSSSAKSEPAYVFLCSSFVYLPRARDGHISDTYKILASYW